jgi:hypothetical protein
MLTDNQSENQQNSFYPDNVPKWRQQGNKDFPLKIKLEKENISLIEYADLQLSDLLEILDESGDGENLVPKAHMHFEVELLTEDQIKLEIDVQQEILFDPNE